jgi:Flp pilus assembly protein TadD
VDALTDLAWLLATCPKADVRDGQQAVTLARKACELDDWKDPGVIEVLAAALAESGDFAEAVQLQKKAVEMPYNSEDALKKAKQRLQDYEQKKPTRSE